MEPRNPDTSSYLFSTRFHERIAALSNPADNLVPEHLRHIRAAVDDTRADVKELRTRVGFIEEGQARLEAQYAHISVRMDRVDVRLERLERRVGLAEV